MDQSIKFLKMCGAGNDFLVYDLREPGALEALEKSLPMPRHEMARQLCHRHHGLGADGFVLLENSDNHDFQWDFYNSDGSTAEMCGNAARCVVRFESDRLGENKNFVFGTGAGTIGGRRIENETVEVQMSPASEVRPQENYSFIDTGVPHAVIEVESFDDLGALSEKAKEIRDLSEFQREGTNVTFYQRTNVDNKIISASHERGVFDFTLACGTGAVAAAKVYQGTHKISEQRIQVQVPGGTLIIDLQTPTPLLIGPAYYIGEMTLNKEWPYEY